MRFVKDAVPAVTPVPYPARVTPLPEDRQVEKELNISRLQQCREGADPGLISSRLSHSSHRRRHDGVRTCKAAEKNCNMADLWFHGSMREGKLQNPNIVFIECSIIANTGTGTANCRMVARVWRQ
ncbi:hypothetical protein E2562_014950 [Oryza meyeriana var. granulata]|uniref:Uncharacterized protein n=1 Tax=Oryza meyeriana var. granulata TaxID=110450 RepID=A0A6G1EIH2_9ORYZ|nr:hypothetical protein E2562_014950 [Oryza meyeriana var. granulata]